MPSPGMVITVYFAMIAPGDQNQPQRRREKPLFICSYDDDQGKFSSIRRGRIPTACQPSNGSNFLVSQCTKKLALCVSAALHFPQRGLGRRCLLLANRYLPTDFENQSESCHAPLRALCDLCG